MKDRMAGVYSIDPGILWMIATTGCRWRPSLMLYEDEEILFEDNSGWCCDNCASAAGIDIRADIPGGALDGPDKVRNSSEKDPDADAALFFGTRGLRVIQWIPDRPPELCKARRGTLLNAIVRWRDGVYQYLGLPTSISPSVVLPDKIVGDLVNNVSGITSKESLYQRLIKGRVRINSTCITPIILSALFRRCCQTSLPASSVFRRALLCFNITIQVPRQVNQYPRYRQLKISAQRGTPKKPTRNANIKTKKRIARKGAPKHRAPRSANTSANTVNRLEGTNKQRLPKRGHRCGS